MGYRRNRRAKRMLFLKLFGRMGLLLLIFCCGFIFYYLVNDQPLPFSGQTQTPYFNGRGKGESIDNRVQGEKRREEKGAWQLMLVNKWNPIPEGYQVTLTKLSNGQSVDRRMYPWLQKMFDAARSQGIYPVVASGYRTAEKQQALMDEKIAEYEAEGCSEAEAGRKAKKWVAVPGTSEHQLGLGVDINADGVHSRGKEVYDWLDGNAFRYGFIRRYPRDKTKITGIINEPWHYRYVGVEAAEEMYRRGVCLEEYLGENENGE